MVATGDSNDSHRGEQCDTCSEAVEDQSQPQRFQLQHNAKGCPSGSGTATAGEDDKEQPAPPYSHLCGQGLSTEAYSTIPYNAISACADSCNTSTCSQLPGRQRLQQRLQQQCSSNSSSKDPASVGRSRDRPTSTHIALGNHRDTGPNRCEGKDRETSSAVTDLPATCGQPCCPACWGDVVVSAQRSFVVRGLQGKRACLDPVLAAIKVRSPPSMVQPRKGGNV